MNYLFEKYHVGYLPGHTPDDNQNIIIICFIHPNAIIEMNADIILTSKIECVVQILDKKMNEYTTGINSYDSNPNIFRKLVGLEFETPLRFYHKDKKCEKKFKKLDKNDDGVLSYEEYKKYCEKRRKHNHH